MSDELMTGGARGAVGAILFLQASMTSLDAYSTLMSSPWTAENFGADEEKADSVREYLKHSIAASSIYVIAASVIAKSYWPIIGGALTNVYLYWLYNRALDRGKVAGSTDWAKNSQPTSGGNQNGDG
jgi:hypothetical protein